MHATSLMFLMNALHVTRKVADSASESAVSLGDRDLLMISYECRYLRSQSDGC